MNKIGIIACGGKATRFKGYPKWLLPDERMQSMLQRHIREFLAADWQPCVITTQETHDLVCALVRGNAEVLMESGENGMWGAIRRGLDKQADVYGFSMSDTWLPRNTWKKYKGEPLWFGTFKTNTSGRFGCFENGAIVDKLEFDEWEYVDAWGCFAMDSGTRDALIVSDVNDYTHALNLAIAYNGMYARHRMTAYYDFASIASYRKFLNDCDIPF